MEISRIDLQNELSRFFAWWIGELSSLIPAKIYSVFKAGSNCLVVDVLDTEIIIGRFQGEGFKELAHIKSSCHDSENNQDAVKKIAQQQKANQIIFRLPEAKTMVRILPDFPQIIENNLEEALFFELEKLTPFRPDELWFDYRICGKNTEKGTMDIQMAMVPKKTILELVKLGQSWGVEPDQVDLVGDDASKQTKFNFLKQVQKIRPSRFGSINWIQSMVALGLLAGVILFPVFHQYQTLQKVNRQVDQIRIKAENSLIVRNKINQIVSESRFFSEYKKKLPAFAEVLEELTKIMPDDVWLDRLGVSVTAIKISGYAKSASHLIEIIEKSNFFKDVVPDSSFIRDPKLERERFKFSFRLEQKGTTGR
ncbi:MAG: PilN domain-containing protein [Magnetococcales bacterium]|nr:PilN domain-containing protein [Magnetococcales bacterium]